MRYLSIRIYLIIPVIFSITLQANATNEKLIFALDLIRHGDRTASSDLPNAPHTWTEGKGQLTSLGMQQVYHLGLKLNQRYMIDNQLLSKNYLANTIYIRSTDFDRTIMSAQSLVLGLYPLGTGPSLPAETSPALPSYFQPIPIHTVPVDQDSGYLIDIGSPQMSELFNRYVYTRADWKAKSAELELNYNHWSKLTGIPLESMFDVLDLGDIIRSYINHKINLPTGLTYEEAQQIIAAADWIYATLFKPNEIGDIAGKEALQQISHYIQQASDHKSKIKFVLLSAHDVTTLGVMSALHAPLSTSPSYSSDLNFSLYEYGTNNYVVRITYNDQPVFVPTCGGNTCTLNQFLSIIK